MNFKNWLNLIEVGTMSSAVTGGIGDIAHFKRPIGGMIRRNWPEVDPFFKKKKKIVESRDWQDTSFKELRSKLPRTPIYGWLSPRGKFYSTEKQMGHLDLIENTPELRSLMPPEFEKKVNDLQKKRKEGEYAMSQGEHPEWHSYEILSDEIEIESYDEMYKRGYLRVATNRDVVGFEGTSLAIMNLYQKARDLAEHNGFEAHFQKIHLT